MVTVWWFAAGLIHYSFLNPGEAITAEKYVTKYMKCTGNCNVCVRLWSTEKAQSFSITTLDRVFHDQPAEAERIRLRNFASFIFAGLFAYRLSLLLVSGQLLNGRVLQ